MPAVFGLAEHKLASGLTVCQPGGVQTGAKQPKKEKVEVWEHRGVKVNPCAKQHHTLVFKGASRVATLN